MTEKTGGDVVVQALKACGVRMVFGVPGTQTVALFDALSRANDVRTVLASDEGSAGFMAHGYYRASGQIAAVVTIPGPGLTNVLTAAGESREDSVALLHIVVGSPADPSRPYGLQPTYSSALSPHIYKGVRHVSTRAELESVVADACEQALSGEPGPVLLSLSPRVLHEMGSDAEARPVSTASHEDVGPALEGMAQRIASSRRLCVLVGQGVSQAAGALVALVEHTGALAITNASGRGIIPDDHPRTVCSDFGGWGSGLVNELIQQSDLVLALGCKLTHNGSAGFSLNLPAEKLVRLDISSEVLSAGYPASLSVVADARAALPRLLGLVRGAPCTGSAWTEEERSTWRSRFESARASSVRHQSDLPDWPAHRVADFFNVLRRVLPRESHLVTDSGQHQVWSRQHYPVWSPLGLILPTDFQSMGFGLPVAMGAKLARPDVPVVAIVGDGGLLMSGLALVTAVQEKIPLSVIVFNDGALSQIQYQQMQEYGRDFATTPGSISMEAFAISLGIEYAVLDFNMEQTLKNSVQSERVTLLELRLRAGASVATAAMVARAKAAMRRGPGGSLLQSLWRRIKSRR